MAYISNKWKDKKEKSYFIMKKLFCLSLCVIMLELLTSNAFADNVLAMSDEVNSIVLGEPEIVKTFFDEDVKLYRKALLN